jgi:SAM-dependent methyltransferase
MPIADDLYRRLVGLSGDEWRDMVVRSLESPDPSDPELPGFPDPAVSTLTTEPVGPEMVTDGWMIYQRLKGAAATHGMELTPRSQVLDFGCGWGRVTRYFLRDVPLHNLHGVDVVPELVETCRQTISAAQFQRIEQLGTLPHDDGRFDLCVANSVFSHLEEALHLRWIAELRRVTRPGGIVVVTLINERVFEKWLEQDTEFSRWFQRVLGEHGPIRRQLREGRFVWRSTRRVGDLTGYGIAVIPESWLAEHWPADLEILEVRSDFKQAVVVARRG